MTGSTQHSRSHIGAADEYFVFAAIERITMIHLYDSYNELLGDIPDLEDLDLIPHWENSLQRSARKILIDNVGYATNDAADVVYDSGDEPN